MTAEQNETTKQGPAGLRWTGHALVDVGVAGLTTFANRRSPEEVTLADLDLASALMEANYYGGKLGTYLTCVFPNSSFVQPVELPETKDAFVRQFVRAHRAAPHGDVIGARCVFSGLPATSPLVRTHLPLFSGGDVLNFRPNGRPWVPVAGAFVVALMFLPMACRRAEGRMLAVYADEPSMTLRFARKYLEDNQRLLALALPDERALLHDGYDREQPMWDSAKKRHKYADAKGPRSLVVDDLTHIATAALPSYARPRGVPLTAYLLSNSGQGPSLEMFEVPSGVVAFVARAAQADTALAWSHVQKKYWPLKAASDDDAKKPAKRAKKAQVVPGRAGHTRNPAFEDLCAIFESGFTNRELAAHWLREHVLGRRDRPDSAAYRDTGARSYRLAALFLEEVLGMKRQRIETIRAFADKVATWINDKNDRKLYRALSYEKLRQVQERLRKVQRESATETLLFGLDEYTSIWLEGERDEPYLVRDLICIRVVERLSELGYFQKHPEDALGAADDDDTKGTEE